eukprot:366085-Chlamydomonas_euryale.AAC.9
MFDQQERLTLRSGPPSFSSVLFATIYAAETPVMVQGAAAAAVVAVRAGGPPPLRPVPRRRGRSTSDPLRAVARVGASCRPESPVRQPQVSIQPPRASPPSRRGACCAPPWLSAPFTRGAGAIVAAHAGLCSSVRDSSLAHTSR